MESEQQSIDILLAAKFDLLSQLKDARDREEKKQTTIKKLKENLDGSAQQIIKLEEKVYKSNKMVLEVLK